MAGDTLVSPFGFGCLYFFFIPNCFMLDLCTKIIKVERVDMILEEKIFVPDLRGKAFKFSPLSLMLAVGLS